MATIILRLGKGSPLTNSELDSNFTNLNTELGTKANSSALASYLPLTGGTLTGTDQVLTILDNAAISSGSWRGRIVSKNETTNIAVFLANFQSKGGLFAHNAALTAWADLYLNTSDGSGGGAVRIGPAAYVSGNTVLHAGNYAAYSLALSGGVMTGAVSFAADLYNYVDNKRLFAGSGGYNYLYTTQNGMLWRNQIDSVTVASLSDSGAFNTLGAITQNGSQVLHAGNYSNYALPLTGGTLTSTVDGILTLNKSGGTAWNYINFSVNGTRRFYFGLNAGYEPELGVDNGATFRVNGNMTVAGNQVLHAGNYTNYASTFNGGTLSGALTVNSNEGVSAIYGGSDGQTWLRGWGLESNRATAYYRPTTNNSATLNIGYAAGSMNWGTINLDTQNLYKNGNEILHAGNYSNYAVPARISTNWNDGTVINNVIGQLGWKNYGNSHVIFDASASTAPNGTSISNTNPTYAWGGTYPTLMGWNGAHTYGVRVDSARYADYAINGLTADNYTGYDGHLRALGNNDGMDFNTSTYNSMYYAYIANSANKPTGYSYDYGTILTFDPGRGSGGRAQFYISHAGNDLIFRGGWNGNGSWQTWNKVLTNQNYNSYSPTLTGGGASGTWGISISGAVNGISIQQGNVAQNVRITTAGGTDSGVSLYNSSGTWQSQWYGNGGGNQYGFLASNWGAWDLQKNINGNLNIQVSGTLREVLHAGNYTSYSPSLSGNYKNIGVGGLYSRYNYNEGAWITDATAASTLSPDYGTTTVAMHNSHGSFGNWATTLTMSGYERYGAYQISGNYNTTTAELAVRNYTQSGSTWTSWIRLLSSANYNSYSPTLTGGGAYGTWGINITGSAGDIGGYCSDGWLRKVNDNTQFQMYGNSRTMIYRTDGTTNPHGGGGYAHIFYYGGSNDPDRKFIISTDGRLYSPYHGWLDQMSVNYASSAGTADQIDSWPFRNTGNNAGTNADTIESNGITYYTAGVPNFSGNATDGALYSQCYSSAWQHQIAGDYRSGQIALRGKNSGTWQSWRTVLDSGNYTNYVQLPYAGWDTYPGKDADTVVGGSWMRSYFTYSNNAPLTGALVHFPADGYDLQINGSYNGDAFSMRSRNGDNSSWRPWKRVLTDYNYNSYSPTLTGGNASGTWGISVTGNAATANRTNANSGYARVGYGMAPFYNWGGNNAGSGAPSDSTYTTGIDVGSNPGDQAYGFQIASNMWNVGLWTRTYNSGFGGWVRLLDSSNYSSYALPLSGGGLTGRLTISPGWTTDGRNYSNEWIEFGNYSGLYSPQNGAHFYPNNGSYGAWRIAGTRNGWSGIEFDASNGNVTLMVDPNSNTAGFHNNNYGWQMRWNNGVGYVHKNAYGGGTAATILDSSNYADYALPLSGGSLSGTLGSYRNDVQQILVSYNTSAAGPAQFFIAHSYGSVNIGNYRGNINVSSGSLLHGGNQVLHAGNYTNYTLPATSSGYVSSDIKQTTSGYNNHYLSGKIVCGNYPLVNDTINYSANGVQISPIGQVRVGSDGSDAAIVTWTNDGAEAFVMRRNSNNAVFGTITTGYGSGASYNSTSDYRLKNIVGEVTEEDSGAFIDGLLPRYGTWKESGTPFIGFVAHEVQAVAKTDIVHGVKDGEEMQVMSYSAAELVANLVAQVKFLRKSRDEQEARIAKLEALVNTLTGA
ncbi:hypothetical protein UFOVP232_47 [uncultured Caudovirales phage]|uniref:Peptidase S74 domain-containing protein n=1 Tax=uncultured Caudovirales phage TaxID=2100421 RepID=A0A6J7WQQ5_9CAUD|nr:hypothetical protein UFOVP232_47 [uncultured Caudovirales phage]